MKYNNSASRSAFASQLRDRQRLILGHADSDAKEMWFAQVREEKGTKEKAEEQCSESRHCCHSGTSLRRERVHRPAIAQNDDPSQVNRFRCTCIGSDSADWIQSVENGQHRQGEFLPNLMIYTRVVPLGGVNRSTWVRARDLQVLRT